MPFALYLLGHDYQTREARAPRAPDQWGALCPHHHSGWTQTDQERSSQGSGTVLERQREWRGSARHRFERLPQGAGSMSLEPGLLTLRLLHILSGVFWVGTLIFNAIFLLPAIRDAGPEGAKVAAALMRRRFLVVIPAVAVSSILSGFWLYWRDSAGFQPAFMRS